jgi:metal-responsive CopG/Arc/MetJ family transcriptional regulator
MSAITVRLPGESLRNLDDCARLVHLPRAEYIRRAIDHMNDEVRNEQCAERLKKASLRVRKESMRINKEFSRIEHDPKN